MKKIHNAMKVYRGTSKLDWRTWKDYLEKVTFKLRPRQ